MASIRTDKPSSILVLMGGTSGEREVSVTSGTRVLEALHRRDYQAEAHIYEGDLSEMVAAAQPYDLIFMALHGGEGEDGTVQRRFEQAGIPFTGSMSEASSLAMDKHQSKLHMREIDVPTANWISIDLPNNDGHLNSGQFPELVSFCDAQSFPLVVKPNSEGSTVGVSIVKSASDLDEAINFAAEFGRSMMVEVYVPGRELTVTVLDNRPLPIVEIVPKHEFYDYESKYVDDMSDYIVPAELSDDLGKDIQTSALKLHLALGCRHYTRSDFRLTEDGAPYCLEINTLPGMTSHSLTPMAAAEVGIGFDDLIEKLILMAWQDGAPS